MTDWIAITDEQIADKVVALNKGLSRGDDGWYHAQSFDTKANGIATDWRIAGALMTEVAEFMPLGRLFDSTIFNEWESLARQVIVSCLIEMERYQQRLADFRESAASKNDCGCSNDRARCPNRPSGDWVCGCECHGPFTAQTGQK